MSINDLIARADSVVALRSLCEILNADLIADGAGVEILPEEIRDALDGAGLVLCHKSYTAGVPVPGVRLVDGELVYSADWL